MAPHALDGLVLYQSLHVFYSSVFCFAPLAFMMSDRKNTFVALDLLGIGRAMK